MTIQEGILRSTRQSLDDANLSKKPRKLTEWIMGISNSLANWPDKPAPHDVFEQALAQCRFALRELGDVVV